MTVARRTPRLAQWCGVLALLPLLTGCIAAVVAVPAMTAAGVFSHQKRIRAATAPTLDPVVTLEPMPETGAGEAGLVPAVEPYAPAGAVDEAWQPFVNYALARAYAMRIGGEPGQSALLTPESRFNLTPSHSQCRASEPAVVVDLDSGATVFAPGAANQPAPGLAAALAQLRSSGIVVLWVSQIDANKVNDVARALRDSGLDAGGRDPLLLARNASERKQVLREEANEDVCVLAIVGDRRGDFDELFDYLREPGAAAGLDTLLGNGWFLVPAPLGATDTTAP